MELADPLDLTRDDLLAWAESQPWSGAMAACPQDPIWHPEGDVWTHTKMVMAELEQVPLYRDLDETSRVLLLWGALLHDVGKPDTTVELEGGRISSPGHSKRGVVMGRDILRDVGMTGPHREEVLKLIRLHGRPPYIYEKKDPQTETISLSWWAETKLLYTLVQADWYGRTAADRDERLEWVEYWRELAAESDCWEKPYSFANHHARFLFFRRDLSSLHYTPREDFSCRVTLMSGLPGAGKDHWLRENRPHLPVVSLDKIRRQMDIPPTENQGPVVAAAQEQCRRYLREGQSFALSATNTVQSTRKRWIDLFHQYGAQISVVYLEPRWDVLLKQNKNRSHQVPEKVIRRLWRKLDVPSLTECHELELVWPKESNE